MMKPTMASFNKSSQSKEKLTAPEPKDAEAISVKYLKPKILFLDLPESASTALAAKGFNISTGTLGRPYRVAKSSGYQPLIGRGNVPNDTEQEIVVVDLAYEKLDNGPQGEKHRPDHEPDLWGKGDKGFLDPRVRTSALVCESFDRTFSIGGVFVVFAAARTGIDVQIACNGYNGLYGEKEFRRDVWCFLSELGDMDVTDDHGREMNPSENKSALARLVAEHLGGGHFTCTLKGGYHSEGKWETLAHNKFGQAVAICCCRSKRGSVIVLPQIADKTGFLTELFMNVLPELSPHLFPDIERGKWIHRPEYELPRVIELRAKEVEVEQRAKAEITALENELVKERAANGWIHNLLTGTDTELVAAVKIALATLGFTKIVDVDEERDREGKSRREDLQLHDQSPLLIVDVKGIGALPSDEDALQADKHAAIRMRELIRTDIIGLSIINHQRHMPPLERVNAMPFRQELLDAAEERMLGLMTAWDLYRLVRNHKRFGWRSEHVKPVFYGKGRIDGVPKHYQYMGTIAKAWTDKFGVVITQGELRHGDRIAVEFPIEFEEVTVDSIRVNDKTVEHAKSGDPTGILWPAGRPKLREGMRVFRIPAAA